MSDTGQYQFKKNMISSKQNDGNYSSSQSIKQKEIRGLYYYFTLLKKKILHIKKLLYHQMWMACIKQYILYHYDLCSKL